MTFSTLRGLGAYDCSMEECVYVPDPIDPPILTPGSSAPSSPIVTALPPLQTVNLPGASYIDPTTGAYVNYDVKSTTGGFVPSGTPATGFNWGGFFSGILPTIFNDATKIGQQAIASPGTVIGPGGTVVTGGGVQSGLPSTSAMNITAMMPLLLLGGAGLVLLMVAKGRR